MVGSVVLPTIFTLGQFFVLGDGKFVGHLMGGKPADAKLVAMVNEVANRANYDPPAHIFEIPTEEMNAFAAGFRRKGTAVAVTSGLRKALNERELKAVLAHEMGHLLAKDTVNNMHMAATIAGLGGVYSAGKVLWRSNEREKSREKRGEDGGTRNVAVLGLGLMGAGLASQGIAHLLRLGTSRRHEFSADAVARELYGADTMISALRKIDNSVARGIKRDALGVRGNAFAHMYISNPSSSAATFSAVTKGRHGRTPSWAQKVLKLFSTHPSLEERVEALQSQKRQSILDQVKQDIAQ